MSSRDRVRLAMVEALGTAAMSVDDLAERVAADPRSGDAGTVRRHAHAIIRDDPAFAEVGGELCHLASLAAGARWTVWVDAQHAADGFFTVYPALAPISWWLVAHGVDLTDASGQVIGRVETDGVWLDGVDTDVLRGPDGWLDAFSGSWAQLVFDAGRLRIGPLTMAPQPTARQVALVRAGFAATATTEEVTLFDGAATVLTRSWSRLPFLHAMLADRAAFVDEPIPFLPDLAAAAGLEIRSHDIADIDFDWDALETRRSRNRMRSAYGIDEQQIDSVTLAVGACKAFAEDGLSALGLDDEQRDKGAILLSALLEDGAVTSAFLDEYMRRHGFLRDIRPFADELLARMDGVRLYGVRWLKATCLESAGEDREAAALIDETVDDECDHVPSLLDAAALAADRGDAALAVRLLTRAGVAIDPDDEDPDDDGLLLREVIGYAANRPRPMAGRNDRCPCGSGRKYKACHLGKERHSLDDRALWLWEKTRRFVRVHDDGLTGGLAEQIGGDARAAVRELQNSPFVADIALHEYEMLGEFVERRGWLLPEDEALLAAQWALVDRSVFEVLDVGRDRLRLRDIATGDTVVVVNATAAPGTRPGTTLVGRPLPVGDIHRAFGGFLPAPQALVNPMLDAIHGADVDTLIELLASTLRPPELRNTSGEHFSLHTLRWALDPAIDVGAALAAAGFIGESPDWHLAVDTPGMRGAVVATVHHEPGTAMLTAEVNSDERAVLIRDRVAAALPSARLVADEQRSFTDIREDADPERSWPSMPDPNDPEIRQMIEELVAQKEAEWIDEQIPALGGRTPRTAVQDPIGREEVRQLLDSFPEPQPGTFGGFSATRLRAMLGLDDR